MHRPRLRRVINLRLDYVSVIRCDPDVLVVRRIRRRLAPPLLPAIPFLDRCAARLRVTRGAPRSIVRLGDDITALPIADDVGNIVKSGIVIQAIALTPANRSVALLINPSRRKPLDLLARARFDHIQRVPSHIDIQTDWTGQLRRRHQLRWRCAGSRQRIDGPIADRIDKPVHIHRHAQRRVDRGRAEKDAIRGAVPANGIVGQVTHDNDALLHRHVRDRIGDGGYIHIHQGANIVGAPAHVVSHP